MNEWIQSVLNAEQTGISVLVGAFLLGGISFFTGCCSYAAVGAITGYTSVLGAGDKKKAVIISSLFVLIGTLISMSVIGFLIGYAGEIVVASIGNYWQIVAGVVLILFGVYILDILPFRIPSMSVNYQSKRTGIIGSGLFGFVIGGLLPFTNICCNPIFQIVIATSFVKGDTLWGGLMLVSFGLGFGIILSLAMFGLGLGVGRISKVLSRFAVIMKYAGGTIMILLGFYFLLNV
jgi:cytochrome c biogenesis protein CcdA